MTLITGGASGLGRATAERFVRNGAKVIICDRQSSTGDRVAQEIGGENVHFLPANVTQAKDIENVLREIEQRLGRLDVVVNCAGRSETFATFNFNRMTPRDLASFEQPLKVKLVWILF